MTKEFDFSESVDVEGVKARMIISSASDGHLGLRSPENRERFFRKHGIDPKRVVLEGASHSSNVCFVDEGSGGKVIKNYDALITQIPDLYLSLIPADCLPITVIDPQTKSIALIHAGWRGLVGKVIGSTIKEMNRVFNLDPRNTHVYMGPHICSDHYEIQENVSRNFEAYFGALKIKGVKHHLDLFEAAKYQLERLGVNGFKIHNDTRCTFENPNLFSHRRGDTDRFMILVGIEKGI